MDRSEFLKTFLEETDNTGRFMVRSSKTGILYCVEPTDHRHNKSERFGDINPSTGEVEGDYGLKYKGSIKKEQSLINEDNGLINIKELSAGTSPHSYIAAIDEVRYMEGFRPKEN